MDSSPSRWSLNRTALDLSLKRVFVRTSSSSTNLSMKLSYVLLLRFYPPGIRIPPGHLSRHARPVRLHPCCLHRCQLPRMLFLIWIGCPRRTVSMAWPLKPSTRSPSRTSFLRRVRSSSMSLREFLLLWILKYIVNSLSSLIRVMW